MSPPFLSLRLSQPGFNLRDLVPHLTGCLAARPVAPLPHLITLRVSSLAVEKYMIVCDTSQKPLVHFHLVHSIEITNALVFTKSESAESTLRLVRLFKFLETVRSFGRGNDATR